MFDQVQPTERTSTRWRSQALGKLSPELAKLNVMDALGRVRDEHGMTGEELLQL